MFVFIFCLGLIGVFTLGFYFGYMSGKAVYKQKKETNENIL